MTRRATVLDSLPDKAVLRMAARHMVALAGDIKRSHTLDGRWYLKDDADTRARMSHDIALALGLRLRAIARGKR